MNSRTGLIGWVSNRVPLLRELPVEVTAISAVAFCVALGFGIVGPVIPAFAREFQVSAFAAGMVVTVFATVRLGCAPIAAKWVDQFGERWVLTVGLAIVSLSSLTAGLSNNYLQLLLFRGMGGLGSVMFSVSSLALLLRVVEADYRGRAASAWSGGFLMGGLTGPALGGVFVTWSLRAPFFVYAITTTAAALVAWRSLRHAHLTENAIEDHGPPLRVGAALRLRAYRAVLASQFSNGFVRFGIANALFAIFVTEVLEVSVAVASAGFFLNSIAQALLLSRTGRWTDSFGRRPILLIGSGIALTSQLLLLLPESVPMFFASMVLLGVSGAFLSGVPAAVIGDLTNGNPRGPVVASSTMAGDLGGVIGPVVGGVLLDLSGSYAVAFVSGVALLLVSGLFAVAMPETKPNS